MIDFFKTLAKGYSILFNDLKYDIQDYGPKVFTSTGTGLMMIGSALIARDSCKAEVQNVIQEANAIVDDAKKENKNEKKATKSLRLIKAKAKKTWKVVKVYKKGFIADAIGAAAVVTGLHISESGRAKAIAGAAAIGSAFASYRAAVREDLGPSADIKYLNGEKAINAPKFKKGETIPAPEPYIEEDGGVTLYKDPEAFRLLFSRESTPELWSDNYDMRIANLQWVESVLSRNYMTTWGYGGNLTLNDMRREFGGLTPQKMDVPIGGLFGRHYIKDKPETHRLINLHYEDDKDFMDGRKDWCYIYFDCDPEPLVGRRRKFTQVERG